ncbi:hypothetical protein P153DRAFT_429638 [Dothidotthia symphoricarpi CBS 119687]|uniref:Uncharacterized protein n=1 Tax=Dothidotthia symphoricarpi CBS 119687 TaxID=1392245 RepID=A0A6A6AKA7_9PLEO|nr:uncharacterized protein P153DRAFT_429638 [Dothidotthia symphoricarpi CBS 119687]KAF2131307.1 hypothetical protein P153DRAFT_429638 [Dothidotthia symphoricarpi CBS 119687]
MPTPNDAMLSPPVEHGSTAGHATCPPDESRIASTVEMMESGTMATNNIAASALEPSMQQPTPPPEVSPAPQPLSVDFKPANTHTETPTRDTPTPMTATDDGTEDQRASQTSPLSANTTTPAPTSLLASQLSLPYPTQRFHPNTSSSRLRPGSRFKGTQTSDRQQYEVEVEIKYVDMRESFMCGYLRIQGLTEDHPSLVTFFESEIIGSKYTFITQHPEWGSNEKVDRQHWARFPAYKPLSKHSSRSDLGIKDWVQKEHLFMRWKESFLVPDHRVKSISGASFEGFYYICFNQISGNIEGIYFHAKSEKFQKLQLEHIEDHGCQGAIEFR